MIDDEEVAALVKARASEMRAVLEQRGSLNVETLLIHAAYWAVQSDNFMGIANEARNLCHELLEVIKSKDRDLLEFYSGLNTRTGTLQEKTKRVFEQLVPLAELGGKAQPFFNGRKRGSLDGTTKYLIQVIKDNPGFSAREVANYVFDHAGNQHSPYEWDSADADAIYEKEKGKSITRAQLITKIHQTSSRYLSSSGK